MKKMNLKFPFRLLTLVIWKTIKVNQSSHLVFDITFLFFLTIQNQANAQKLCKVTTHVKVSHITHFSSVLIP